MFDGARGDGSSILVNDRQLIYYELVQAKRREWFQPRMPLANSNIVTSIGYNDYCHEERNRGDIASFVKVLRLDLGVQICAGQPRALNKVSNGHAFR